MKIIYLLTFDLIHMKYLIFYKKLLIIILGQNYQARNAPGPATQGQVLGNQNGASKILVLCEKNDIVLTSTYAT